MNDPAAAHPRTVALEVTGRCHFTCRHCAAPATSRQGPDLGTDPWRHILSAAARLGSSTALFTGGDPLERDDILPLLRHARTEGLRPVLSTCGSRVDTDLAGRLRAAGVACVCLALDGASAETHDGLRQAPGSFAAALAAAETLRAVGLPLQINTTLTRLNRSEVIAIAALVERLGAVSFNPFVLVPAGRERDLTDPLLDPVEYETLLNELLTIKQTAGVPVHVTCGPQMARIERRRAETRLDAATGCLGGRDYLFITRRGDVQACGLLPIAAGNLVANGYDLRRVWEQAEVLRQLRNRDCREGRCGLCEYLQGCGGCRARAFLATGDYLGDDPLCRGPLP